MNSVSKGCLYEPRVLVDPCIRCGPNVFDIISSSTNLSLPLQMQENCNENEQEGNRQADPSHFVIDVREGEDQQ